MKTFVFGASGFAKEVEWLLYEMNCEAKQKINIDFFVVADIDCKKGETLNSIPIIAEKEYLEIYNKKEKHNCILALGDPFVREKVFQKINNDFTHFPTLIHPSVIFDKRFSRVNFGTGCIICAGTILTTNIYVGQFVHLNLDCTIGHDSVIGDFVTISPSVNVSGKVRIGKKVFIGTGVQINEELNIDDNVVLGAGAVVIKSISDPGTYVGIPSKKVNK